MMTVIILLRGLPQKPLGMVVESLRRLYKETKQRPLYLSAKQYPAQRNRHMIEGNHRSTNGG